MKSEESAGCPQTLSSRVGSGDEIRREEEGGEVKGEERRGVER